MERRAEARVDGASGGPGGRGSVCRLIWLTPTNLRGNPTLLLIGIKPGS